MLNAHKHSLTSADGPTAGTTADLLTEQLHQPGSASSQLNLNIIEAEVHADTDPSDLGPGHIDVPVKGHRWQLTNRHQDILYQLRTPVLVVALVVLSAIAFQQSESETIDFGENFNIEDSSPAEPISRSFPDISFRQPGSQLQIGLFSRLAGAEAQQGELIALGLTARIEKRVSDESVLYAVTLNPLTDAEHATSIRTLDANDLSYFHVQTVQR